MREVKSIKYNWKQFSSLHGSHDECGIFTVGENGVKSIEENEPHNGMQLWNYVITMDSGVVYRIFNPNFVEYFPS